MKVIHYVHQDTGHRTQDLAFLRPKSYFLGPRATGGSA